MRHAFLGLTGLLALGCASDAARPEPSTGEMVRAASMEPSPVRIAGRDGRFPPRVALGDRELLLQGSGRCEWGIFGIDLYHAALYVERSPEDAADALRAEQIMAIHLEFVRALTTEQLQEAYRASVRANTGDDFDSYRADLDLLTGAMQTVGAGESYTFLAEPGRGLVVQRNQQELVTIPGDRFRTLFVRLYLGDQPPTAALRAALLGSAR